MIDTSKSPMPWDLRYLSRFQLEYTETRLLIVKNKNIILDPKSRVSLPTSYFDPGSKEILYTLKNDFVSLIVFDEVSSFPYDQYFKFKLIESLVTEGSGQYVE